MSNLLRVMLFSFIIFHCISCNQNLVIQTKDDNEVINGNYGITKSSKQLQIPINPSAEIIYNLRIASMNTLEIIREKFGSFSPTSAYRCKRLNKAVNGSSKSFHCFGMAFDINLKERNKELFKFSS